MFTNKLETVIVSFEASPVKTEKVASILFGIGTRESQVDFRRNRNVFRSIALFVATVLFLLIILPISLNPGKGLNVWLALYFSAISFVMGLLISNLPGSLRFRTVLYTSLGQYGEVTVSLTEDGLQTAQNGTVSLTPWHLYRRAIQEKGMVLLLREPLAASFVPVDAFKSEGELEKFLYLAKSYISNAEKA